STNLKSKAPALQDHHRWRAPLARKMVSGTAHHCAAAVASTYYKGCFNHGWNHDNTLGLVQQILRYVLGDVQYFAQYLARVLQTLFLFRFVIVSSGDGGCHQ